MKYLKLENTRLDGRYDVQALLGRGSYAEIFVARDVLASPDSPHCKVVIKALNVFLQNDLDHDLERTLVENFQNEAVALDQVRHPNITSRIGHGTARDMNGTVFHYLALEYLSGGDMAKAYRERRHSLVESLNYIEQVSSGLAFAHERGVIHRDIKPQNLLLTDDKKTVKIADFGVARFSNSETPITRVGTNIYAPPEHSPMLAGQTGTLVSPKLTPAADIYSLAKTSYVLITGESPRSFSNHAITELPFALRKKSWATELVTVLNKATQSESGNRYQSVNDFWNDLAKLRTGTKFFREPLSAQPSTSSRYAIPRPHVARGYQPFAPKQPTFIPSNDLSGLSSEAEGISPQHVVNLQTSQGRDHINPQFPETEAQKSPYFPNPILVAEPGRRRKRYATTLLIFIGLLFIFAGALFATQYYISNGSLFSTITGVFHAQTGISTTDINLRSKPNAFEDNRIGVVTKNSRLRIVNEVEDWYEIEIIEHGRPPLSLENTDRGWVYGKYVKVEDN